MTAITNLNNLIREQTQAERIHKQPKNKH